MIVVQHIETIWTKKSRGMPGAAKRNAVPRKLEVPKCDFGPDGILIHKVFAREDDDFNLEQKTEMLNESNKYWTLTFQPKDSAVQILFAYNYYEHGHPDRGTYRGTLFRLGPRKQGTLHINGRFSSYSGQYYKQHFVNIGNVDKFNPKLFLENKPDYFVDKMANLF